MLVIDNERLILFDERHEVRYDMHHYTPLVHHPLYRRKVVLFHFDAAFKIDTFRYTTNVIISLVGQTSGTLHCIIIELMSNFYYIKHNRHSFIDSANAWNTNSWMSKLFLLFNLIYLIIYSHDCSYPYGSSLQNFRKPH